MNTGDYLPISKKIRGFQRNPLIFYMNSTIDKEGEEGSVILHLSSIHPLYLGFLQPIVLQRLQEMLPH